MPAPNEAFIGRHTDRRSQRPCDFLSKRQSGRHPVPLGSHALIRPAASRLTVGSEVADDRVTSRQLFLGLIDRRNSGAEADMHAGVIRQTDRRKSPGRRPSR